MKEERLMTEKYCVGELKNEFREFEKVCAVNARIEGKDSTTARCTTFMTLICC